MYLRHATGENSSHYGGIINLSTFMGGGSSTLLRGFEMAEVDPKDI